jgi:baseplate hub protein gp41
MNQTTFTPTIASKKFQRTYQVFIEAINGSTFEFGSADGLDPLLTMEFNVIRGYQAAVQSGNFRIRNINPNTRNNIFKDGYNLFPRSVKVLAGYAGTPLATIFQGNAQTIMSYREEGATDWITEIIGMDWSWMHSSSWSAWTDNPGTGQKYTQQQVITHLANDAIAYASSKGQNLAIGAINGFFTPRYAYTANDFTMNLLAIESNRLAYIDNGKIYCFPSNYVFNNPDVTLISSSTGLLGTPRQTERQLICQLLFEPGLQVGQSIYLDTESSEFSSAINGLYQVVGVQHAGTISSTIAGKCITTVTLQYINTPIVVNPGLYT